MDPAVAREFMRSCALNPENPFALNPQSRGVYCTTQLYMEVTRLQSEHASSPDVTFNVVDMFLGWGGFAIPILSGLMDNVVERLREDPGAGIPVARYFAFEKVAWLVSGYGNVSPCLCAFKAVA